MGILTMYVIAFIWGLIGGVAHQLHDSEEPNKPESVGRGALMGAIAAILIVSMHPITSILILIPTTFGAGWFGDSVILNIVRRYRT